MIVYLIWLQQRLGQQEKACAWGLEKKLWYVHMTCHLVLPFIVRWWGGKVTMQVLRRQREDAKNGSQNDA